MADKPPSYGIANEAEMSALRQRIVALQKSAANLAQLSLDELSTLLPPGTSREQLVEIKRKLEQLHHLQNRGNERDMSPKDLMDSHVLADDILLNRGSRYKTELCRPYEENGICKYGARCQFAHGPSEIRNLTRHPKYKSQLCRTFHSNGLCPYGHRCHFIHNQDEMRVGVPTSATISVKSSFDSNNNRIITSNNNNNNNNNSSNNKTNSSIYGKNAYSAFGGLSWNGMSFSQFQPGHLKQVVTLPQTLFVPPVVSKPLPIFPSGPAALSGTNAVSTSTSPIAGFSIGSAGELSPPMSPIVYSPDDPFSPQTAGRPGYFFPGGSNAPAPDKLLPIRSRSFGEPPAQSQKLTEGSSLLSADGSNMSVPIADLSRQVPIWWKGK